MSEDTSAQGERREVPSYGFGMAPISENMRARYTDAIEAGLYVLQQRSVRMDQLACLSELKGMYNRCFRKDQWDWSSVHRELGRPDRTACKEIALVLKRLRDAAKNSKQEVVEEALDKLEQFGVRNHLQYYVDYQNGDVGDHDDGWVYMISAKREPNLIKIGRTDREPFTRIAEINRATGVTYPYSIRKLFRVRDSKRAERMAHDLLSNYRVRSDREFFRVSFSKAVRILEREYRASQLLADRETGTLKWFDSEKRYGFIERPSEQDVFLHASDMIDTKQMSLLESGVSLEFETRMQERGPKAVEVFVLANNSFNA